MKKNIYLLLLTLPSLLFTSCEGGGSAHYDSRKENPNTKVVKISFLNAENLFDDRDNFSQNRTDFTSARMFNYGKVQYGIKLKNTAKTIIALDADIIGLAEIENQKVANDLLMYLGANYKMSSIHNTENNLTDVVLYYRTDRHALKLVSNELEPVNSNGLQYYYGAVLNSKFTLDSISFSVVVTHLPSEADVKPDVRSAYVNALVKSVNKDEKTILMGDYNAPLGSNIFTVFKTSTKLENPFKTTPPFRGSVNVNGQWLLNDAILLQGNSKFAISKSEINDLSFLKDRKNKGIPYATYEKNGKIFNPDGMSDHFPVSIELLIHQ